MTEQLNIAELRRLASVIREPRHGIGCIASDCALASEARNALPALLDAADERDRLKAQVYNLKSRICKMDCRYTMGDTADISGSHCESPCDRCEAERDYEALRAERDEWKALYQTAVKHAAKKPF